MHINFSTSPVFDMKLHALCVVQALEATETPLLPDKMITCWLPPVLSKLSRRDKRPASTSLSPYLGLGRQLCLQQHALLESGRCYQDVGILVEKVGWPHSKVPSFSSPCLHRKEKYIVYPFVLVLFFSKSSLQTDEWGTFQSCVVGALPWLFQSTWEQRWSRADAAPSLHFFGVSSCPLFA